MRCRHSYPFSRPVYFMYLPVFFHLGVMYDTLQETVKNDQTGKKMQKNTNIFYLNTVGFKADIAYGTV